MRQRHLDDLGARSREGVPRGLAGGEDRRFETFAEILRGPADPRAGDLAVVEARGEIPHGIRRRRRVVRIGARDDREKERGVRDLGSHLPDLVQRRAECDQPVAGDPAVCRFYADRPAEGRGLADRAACLAAQRNGNAVCRDRHDRAARRTARHAGRIVRVPRRAEGGVLGGGSHRELVEFVFPTTIAPASRSRAIAVASNGEI